MQDDSLLRVRRVLLARLEVLVLAWAPALGIGVESLRDWVDGIVGEGIAVAISQEAKWDPEKGDFLHWAFLKAKRILRKELKCESRYRRAMQSLQAMVPTTDPPITRSNLDTLRDELLEVLEQLPLEHQQALVLYYLNGMTVDRLAEVLGKKTTDAVYALLSRARKRAQKLWKGIGKTAEPSREPQVRRPRMMSSVSLEEDRRKELELRAFVDRLFGLSDNTIP